MNTTRKFIIVIIVVLFMPLFGCSSENEVGISATPPSSFGISIPDNVIDLKGEITSQLALAYERAKIAEAMDRNTDNGVREFDEHDLYVFNNVASLGEFYLVGIEIDGFVLAAITIGRGHFSYSYRCIVGSDDSVAIHIRRLQYPRTPDESWQSVKEQMLEHPTGAYLTEDGMVYVEGINSIYARIGNSSFRMIVPDRLNNLEFVHNLALEVIATHELVVLN